MKIINSPYSNQCLVLPATLTAGAPRRARIDTDPDIIIITEEPAPRAPLDTSHPLYHPQDDVAQTRLAEIIESARAIFGHVPELMEAAHRAEITLYLTRGYHLEQEDGRPPLGHHRMRDVPATIAEAELIVWEAIDKWKSVIVEARRYAEAVAAERRKEGTR